ncbi:MAG: PD40 domain-containing protein [Anaerolineae bacterium]|nr:PD40 domain-containing protein [Anaerolineae bacterium]
MRRKVVLSITWGVLFLLLSACSVFEQEPLPTLVPVIELPEETATATAVNTTAQTSETAVPPTFTPPAAEPVATEAPTPTATPIPPQTIDNRGALVYINSAGAGLFLTRPDGSAQTQYYALESVTSLLPASFNGQRIGFVQDGQLMVARTDGSGLGEITAVANPAWLIWSPTADQFALVDNGDLVVIQADSGAANRVVTGMQLANIPGSVVWSSDGRQLLFTCGAQATDLCRVAADASEAVVNLTNNGADSFAWYREPRWSPDGSLISYVSPDADKNLQLWVMNADGSGARQLTVGSGQSSLHQWSPDGQRLVYALFADNAWHARVVNVDGTNDLDLTGGLPALAAVVPQWGAQGAQVGLLYTADAAVDAVSIALVAVDGTAVTPLTDNGWQLTWSADGQQVAYIAGDGQIYIHAASGGDNPRIITCEGGCKSFVWLP